MCKRIVTCYDGNISLESELDKGSKFTFYFRVSDFNMVASSQSKSASRVEDGKSSIMNLCSNVDSRKESSEEKKRQDYHLTSEARRESRRGDSNSQRSDFGSIKRLRPNKKPSSRKNLN